MASDVKRLGENIGELLTLVKSSATRIQQLESDLKELKELNTTLLTQNSTLLENIQSKNTTNTKVNNKSLIIGSSLIRNFDEAKLNNHKVCCMPGAQTADVKTKLNTLAEDGNHYKSIFIVVGGNDASASEDKVDIDSAVSSMRDIITSCKRMSDDITISAIPPRAEPAHALAMIHPDHNM